MSHSPAHAEPTPLWRRLVAGARRRTVPVLAIAAVAAVVGGVSAVPASATDTVNTGTITWNGVNGAEWSDPGCQAGQTANFHFILSGKGAKLIDAGTGTATYAPSGSDSVKGTIAGNGAGHYRLTGAAGSSVTSFVVTGVSWTGTKPFLKLSDSSCSGTPTVTKVDIPAMPGYNDKCNPEGFDDNVAWDVAVTSLDTAGGKIAWTESVDGRTRTATLVGKNVEWTDGTTAPKTYTLPADSGVKCENPVVKDAVFKVTTTPATCEADGSASIKKLVNATLVKVDGKPATELDQTPGTHTAKAKADAGHAFADGSLTKTVTYTVPSKLTGEQCQAVTLAKLLAEPKCEAVVTLTNPSTNPEVKVYRQAENGAVYVTTLAPGASYDFTADVSDDQLQFVPIDASDSSVVGDITSVTVNHESCTVITKVDIPAMPGYNDKCNPPGFDDNVAWDVAVTSLDTANGAIKWTESADGRTRTAELTKVNTTWTDGSLTPKTYTLPADSGVKCETPVIKVTPVAPSVLGETCVASDNGKPQKGTVQLTPVEGARFSIDGVAYRADGTYRLAAGTYTAYGALDYENGNYTWSDQLNGWSLGEGGQVSFRIVVPAADCPQPPPVTDKCPNIKGVQTDVPKGMKVDKNGNCYTPKTPVKKGPKVETDGSDTSGSPVLPIGLALGSLVALVGFIQRRRTVRG